MVAVTLLSDSSHAVARQYGNVEMLPTTIVVDREGRLRARHVGVLSADGLLDLLAPALIEEGSSAPGVVGHEPAGVRALTPAAVPELVAAGAALLDVREAAAEGTLAHATHRPLPSLSRDDLPANFAAPVIFLGETLAEAREAAERAAAWGYAVVYAVGGGEREWRRAGLEVVPVGRSGNRVIG
jgi:rhodanese-related sulfurtransferase